MFTWSGVEVAWWHVVTTDGKTQHAAGDGRDPAGRPLLMASLRPLPYSAANTYVRMRGDGHPDLVGLVAALLVERGEGPPSGDKSREAPSLQ